MAADAVELATAYVSLVPSMKDSQGLISKSLIPGAESAGGAAGLAAGGAFSGKMGKVLAGGALVGGVVAGFKGLYEVGQVFDNVADTIRVGTGASGAALDGLTESAKRIGQNVPASFEAVGSTVADLNTRLGLSGGTLETVASQYLEAGRILGSEIDIGTTTAAFSAFQIKGADVEGAMDSLFRVSQATGVGMNELAASVQKNAPAMQTLGFSFEETAALAGTLDKAGLNSTAMMSAMSKGMVTLAKAGEEPEAAFKRVTGEIGGFIASGDKAAALELAAKVFGTKGAAQFVGALESGAVSMDNLVAGAGLTGDSIMGVAAETQDFAEKWQLVQNKATAALEPLGSAVFSWLADTLTALMPTLEAVAGWLSENTWAFGVIAGVIGGALVAAFVVWTASIWAATVALLANPITWVVLAVLALIAALVFLAMNQDAVAAWIAETWGGLMNWLGEVFGGLGNWLTEIWDGFTSWFMGALAGFGAWVVQVWDGLWNWVGEIFGGFGNWIVQIWDGLWAWVSSVWSGFVGWFMGGLSAFAAWVGSIWSAVSSFAMSVWNGLLSFIGGIPGAIFGLLGQLAALAGMALGWFGGVLSAAMGKLGELIGFVAGIPGQIIGFFVGLGSMLFNAGSQIIGGLLDGLRAGFQGVMDFVGGIGSWIAANKGPKAYDMALLIPAGGWIMGGLNKGLTAEIPALEKTMSDITDTIRIGGPGGLTVSGDLTATAAGYGPAAGAGSGRVQNITVNNPVPEPAGASITSTLAKVAYLGLEGD